MAKNITLMGADYPDVPAVQLPQTGGGTATFYDLELKRILYYASNKTVSSANGYVKAFSWSDLGEGITLKNVVSVSRYSSNFTAATWLEVYTDGVYIYCAAAESNKWMRINVILTSQTMDSETKP